MEEQGQGDELYPIAVLIDELKVRISPDDVVPACVFVGKIYDGLTDICTA